MHQPVTRVPLLGSHWQQLQLKIDWQLRVKLCSIRIWIPNFTFIVLLDPDDHLKIDGEVRVKLCSIRIWIPNFTFIVLLDADDHLKIEYLTTSYHNQWENYNMLYMKKKLEKNLATYLIRYCWFGILSFSIKFKHLVTTRSTCTSIGLKYNVNSKFSSSVHHTIGP